MHFLDQVGRAAQRVAQRQAVARLGDGEDQIVAADGDAHIARRDAVVHPHDVERLAAPAGIVLDDVLAEALAEDIGVGVALPLQEVVARPAAQRVVAVAAAQRIVAPAAVQRVGTRVAVEGEIARTLESRAVEIDGGERGGRDIGQPRDGAQAGDAGDVGVGVIDDAVRAVGQHHQRAGQPFAQPDVEDVARIARFEIGDQDMARRIVDHRQEQAVGVAGADSAGQRFRADIAAAAGCGRTAAAPARAAGRAATGEDRIGEGIGIAARGIEQRLRRFLAHHQRIELARAQQRAVGEQQRIDAAAARCHLVDDAQPVGGADDAQDQVVAVARDDQVVPGHARAQLQPVDRPAPVAFHDGVAPAAAPEAVDIVADAARQPVVARRIGKGDGRVDGAAEIDRIVPGAAARRGAHDVGQRPHRAVGEDEPLHPVVQRSAHEEIDHADAVVRPGDADHQVARAGFHEHDIVRRDAGGEADAVDIRAGIVVAVDDGVLPVAAGEEIGVRPVMPDQRVVAAAAVEHVVAATAVEDVVAAFAEQVAARSAAGIGLRAGHLDDIVVVGGGDILRQHGDRQGGPVGKAQRAHRRIGIHAAVEQQGDAIAAGADQQHEVAVHVALRRHVGRRDAFAELDRAEAVGGAARADTVVPVAQVEAVDVAALPVQDRVVAAPAAGILRSRAAQQRVVAAGRGIVGQHHQVGARERAAVAEFHRLDGVAANDDGVVRVGEGDPEVAAAVRQALHDQVGRAVAGDHQLVGAAGILDHVVPVAIGELVGVVAQRPAQQIVAAAARDGVGAVAAAHIVVARALLALDRFLHQRGLVPHHAVGKFECGQCARARRALHQQLVAAGEGQDQVVAVDRCLAHAHEAGRHIVVDHQRRGDARCHLHRIQPVALAQQDDAVLPHDRAVETGARLQRHARFEIAGVEQVLPAIGKVRPDQGADFLDIQHRAVGEFEAFDGRGVVTAQHHQPVVDPLHADHQVAVDIAEDDIVLRQPQAEHDPVHAVAVEDAVVARIDAEMVGVVAAPALHRIGPGAGAEGVVADVEADQIVVARRAGQHQVDDIVEGQHGAVGEVEFLHPGAGKGAADRHHVVAIAQVDQHVRAIAGDDQRVALHRCAEHDLVDHARAVGLFHDRVEIVIRAEGVGVAQIAADQRVVALPPVQHVLVVEAAGDDVVAAIAAHDGEAFLDIGDGHEIAADEFEPLHPVIGVQELVADAQRVAAIHDGDHQVVAVLREDDVVDGDVVAELDGVVHRHMHAAPVAPVRADAGVDDDVVAVADIEQVGVAAVAADQQVVARAAVDGLGEVGAGDRLRRVRPDEVDVLRIEIAEVQRHVGEFEQLDRELLLAVADILVFQDDPLARRLDRDDEVERGAREFHVAAVEDGEIDAVVAAFVERGVGAVIGAHHVDVVARQAFQPVVAQPAVHPVGETLETVDVIVAVGLGDGDVVAQQLHPRPGGAVGEFQEFDQVGVADDGDVFEVVGEDDLVGRALHLQPQRVFPPFAQEVEIGPAQVVLEFEVIVLGRTEERHRPVGIDDDVLPVIDAVDIGVDAFLAGQEIVALAAVQLVVVEVAVDGIVIVGLGVVDHALDDGLEIERGVLFEDDLLDHVGRDEIQPVVGAEDFAEQAEIQAHAAELALDLDRIPGDVAVLVEDGDEQVLALPVAGQAQAILGDVAAEHQEVHAGLHRTEGEAAQVVDDVVAVAFAEDVGVAARAAAQVIVALAAEQDVARARADIRVRLVQLRAFEIDHGEGQAIAVPHRAVGEHHRVHARLHLLPGVDIAVFLTQELVLDADVVGAVIVIEEQVFAVAHRPYIVGRMVGEAQLVLVAQIVFVDRVVAGIVGHEIDVALHPAVEPLRIGREAAGDDLVAFAQDEEVHPGMAQRLGIGGVLLDDARFLHAQRVGDRHDVEVDGDVLERRQDVLEDEGLVDIDARIEEIARVGGLVLGQELREHVVPVDEVIVDRIAFVGSGRAFEDRLEHRHQLAVGQRAEEVVLQRVFDAFEELRQPALRGDADTEPHRADDILRHRRGDELDHRLHDGIVLGFRQRVAAALRHLVIDQPGSGIERGGEHFLLEIEARQAGGELELAGRQQFDPVGAALARIHLVQRGEVHLVIAQVELAAVAGLELQLQRAVQIARPDVEFAVLVGDAHRVIGDDPVGEAHADMFDVDIGILVEADGFHAPFQALGSRQSEDVVHGGPGDGVAVRIGDRPPARQPPAAIGVADAVIGDDEAPVDDAAEIGRFLAVLDRRGAVDGRPRLFQLPGLPGIGGHGQHVFQRGAGDDVAIAIGDRGAAFQHPVPAAFILAVDAAIDQRDLARPVIRQQHRRQLAGQFLRLAPIAQDIAHLLAQHQQIGRGHLRGGGLDHLEQADIVGGGDVEVGQRAIALGLDVQVLLPRRQPRFARIDRARIEIAEDRLVHVAGGAVGEHHLAEGQQLGALRRGQVHRRVAEVDGGDPHLVQRLQLAIVGADIAVGVLPQPQFGPDQVGRGDLAVAVAAILHPVVERQVVEPALIGIAEHFGDVVDPAIVVDVAHQEGVVVVEPRGQLGEQVHVPVEIALARIGGDGFHPVAVEVDHQRIAARRPGQVLGRAHRRARQPVGLVHQRIGLQRGEQEIEDRRRLDDRCRHPADGAHDGGEDAGHVEDHAEAAGVVLQRLLIGIDAVGDAEEGGYPPVPAQVRTELDVHVANALVAGEILLPVSQRQCLGDQAPGGDAEQDVRHVGDDDVHVAIIDAFAVERGAGRRDICDEGQEGVVEGATQPQLVRCDRGKGERIGDHAEHVEAAGLRAHRPGDRCRRRVAARQRHAVETQDVVVLRIHDGGVGGEPEMVGIGAAVGHAAGAHLPGHGVAVQFAAHGQVDDQVAANAARGDDLFLAEGEQDVVALAAVQDELALGQLVGIDVEHVVAGHPLDLARAGEAAGVERGDDEAVVEIGQHDIVDAGEMDLVVGEQQVFGMHLGKQGQRLRGEEEIGRLVERRGRDGRLGVAVHEEHAVFAEQRQVAGGEDQRVVVRFVSAAAAEIDLHRIAEQVDELVLRHGHRVGIVAQQDLLDAEEDVLDRIAFAVGPGDLELDGVIVDEIQPRLVRRDGDGQHVAAAAAVVMDGILAVIADQLVLAVAAPQVVVARAAIQQVVAELPAQHVVAVGAQQRIGGLGAGDVLVPVAAHEHVDIGPAIVIAVVQHICGGAVGGADVEAGEDFLPGFPAQPGQVVDIADAQPALQRVEHAGVVLRQDFLAQQFDIHRLYVGADAVGPDMGGGIEDERVEIAAAGEDARFRVVGTDGVDRQRARILRGDARQQRTHVLRERATGEIVEAEIELHVAVEEFGGIFVVEDAAQIAPVVEQRANAAVAERLPAAVEQRVGERGLHGGGVSAFFLEQTVHAARIRHARGFRHGVVEQRPKPGIGHAAQLPVAKAGIGRRLLFGKDQDGQQRHRVPIERIDVRPLGRIHDLLRDLRFGRDLTVGDGLAQIAESFAELGIDRAQQRFADRAQHGGDQPVAEPGIDFVFQRNAAEIAKAGRVHAEAQKQFGIDDVIERDRVVGVVGIGVVYVDPARHLAVERHQARRTEGHVIEADAAGPGQERGVTRQPAAQAVAGGHGLVAAQVENALADDRFPELDRVARLAAGVLEPGQCAQQVAILTRADGPAGEDVARFAEAVGVGAAIGDYGPAVVIVGHGVEAHVLPAGGERHGIAAHGDVAQRVAADLHLAVVAAVVGIQRQQREHQLPIVVEDRGGRIGLRQFLHVQRLAQLVAGGAGIVLLAGGGIDGEVDALPVIAFQHRRGDFQRDGGAILHLAHGPAAVEAVVAALAGGMGAVVEPVGQQRVERHAIGPRGAVIGDLDTEGNGVEDFGLGIVAHQRQPGDEVRLVPDRDLFRQVVPGGGGILLLHRRRREIERQRVAGIAHVHPRGDLQRGDRALVDLPDGPHARGIVVGPARGHEGQPLGQRARQLHAFRARRTVVDDGDGEGDLVVLLRARLVAAALHRGDEVGDVLHRDRLRQRVAAGQRVGLVGDGVGGGEGQRFAAGAGHDGAGDLQRDAGARRDGADGPDAGRIAVDPAPGRRAGKFDPAGQRARQRHAGGVLGAGIEHGDAESDPVAFRRGRIADERDRGGEVHIRIAGAAAARAASAAGAAAPAAAADAVGDDEDLFLQIVAGGGGVDHGRRCGGGIEGEELPAGARLHHGGDGQRGAGEVAQRADRPQAGGGIVGAVGRFGGDEAEAVGQQARQRHVRRAHRPVVEDRHREHHGVAHAHFAILARKFYPRYEICGSLSHSADTPNGPVQLANRRRRPIAIRKSPPASSERRAASAGFTNCRWPDPHPVRQG